MQHGHPCKMTFSIPGAEGNTLSMYLEYLGVQHWLALTYENANAAGNQ